MNTYHLGQGGVYHFSSQLALEIFPQWLAPSPEETVWPFLQNKKAMCDDKRLPHKVRVTFVIQGVFEVPFCSHCYRCKQKGLNLNKICSSSYDS